MNAESLIADMENSKDRRGNCHDIFALPLPARTMCFMLGADQSLYRDYKRWADRLQSLLFNDTDPSAEQTLIVEIPAAGRSARTHRQLDVPGAAQLARRKGLTLLAIHRLSEILRAPAGGGLAGRADWLSVPLFPARIASAGTAAAMREDHDHG